MPAAVAGHERKRSLLLITGGVVILHAMVVVSQVCPPKGLLAYRVRARPEVILGVDKITARKAKLLRMGLLTMSPSFREPEELAADTPAALGVFGQACPAPNAQRLAQNVPPSTALLPSIEAVPGGMIVVSLVCGSDDLFDPEKGIVMHPLLRGRPSERPTWMSARLGSELLVQSPVGLRIHGGHSRGAPEKSFTASFREDYSGHAKSPAGLFFGADTPPARQFILLNADHYSRFNGALAIEIATLLGCKTSRLTPAVVYLNGTLIKMPYFLYQQQSPSFVSARFGIEKPDWYRLKGINTHISDEFNALRRWIRSSPAPMALQTAAERYDIEDLSAWALAVAFTATTDNNQGAYFRDTSNPKSPWQGLTWDMDCSFNNEPSGEGKSGIENSKDPFASLDGYRGELFLRLFYESAEYRSYFEQFARQKLDQCIPRDKVMALADRYVRLATTLTAPGSEALKTMQEAHEFLLTRHEFFQEYLDQKLKEAARTQGALADEVDVQSDPLRPTGRSARKQSM